MGLKLCCISKREALAKKAGTPPQKHLRIFVEEYDCSLFQGRIEMLKCLYFHYDQLLYVGYEDSQSLF